MDNFSGETIEDMIAWLRGLIARPEVTPLCVYEQLESCLIMAVLPVVYDSDWPERCYWDGTHWHQGPKQEPERGR